MGAEQQALFLPYYLKADFLGKSHADATWGFTALAAAALIWAIYRIVRAATGGYQSDLRKLCAAAPEGAEVAAERMEQFYENVEPVGPLHIGGDWVIWQDGARTCGPGHPGYRLGLLPAHHPPPQRLQDRRVRRPDALDRR